MGKDTNARTLYRPIGLKEAVLILEAGARAFPPRRPDQPIFYPVLNREYAEQIARDWNAPHEPYGYAGFVTEFQLDAAYLAQFEEQVVGSAMHREIWVPSERLEEFNQHLLGPIAITRAYYGTGYVGPVPERGMLKDRTAREQLPLLQKTLDYNSMDFGFEVRVQWLLVQLNFAYWVRTDLGEGGLPLDRKVRLLRAIREVWSKGREDVTLVGSDELDGLTGISAT